MKAFAFEGLKWQSYYKNYVTPREWKHGSRDIPFGLGAKSLYVDGTIGDDSNDGLSWKTAKQKIQSTVDVADDWTNIFIKGGTYVENVNIELDHIQLLGESRNSVIVAPPESIPLQVYGSFCKCLAMTIKNYSVEDYSIRLEGDYSSVSNMTVLSGIAPSEEDPQNGVLVRKDNCLIDLLHIVADNFQNGVSLIDANYCEVRNCYIDLSHPTADTYGISLALSDDCRVSVNEIKNAETGIKAFHTTLDNLIFHNNVIDITLDYLKDSTGGNHWFENYISEHTNVDNGYGIANEPYSFPGGSDPRPVVIKSGWNWLSIGSTITNILEELELEAIHDSILFPEDTNETVTFTAGGAINTFGAWVEIVDNNAVTFSSKLTTDDGHISALSIESANTNNKIYLLEIAYGAAKTVVVRHRFKSGVGVETFQSWRQKTLKIPTGETVYYRMKCETALATCTIDFRYHFHS